ncbi:MAG: TraB/GumN family protein [Pseudohongiellaceae bacterium]
MFAVSKSSLAMLFALVSVFTSAFNLALADSSVWRVESDGKTVFLGGTVHLLRTSDYPLPDEYASAYEQSEKLYFETDLNSMGEMAVQARLLKQLSYGDDRSLKTVLNDEAYTALAAYTDSVGLPLAMMEKFKPGMLVTTLQVMEFQRIGFTPQGVDAYFNTLAMGDGKPLGQLESIDDQIGFLSAMGEGNESEFILLSLRDIEGTADIMDDMIQAWRKGDNKALSELFVSDLLNESPEIYDSLLKQRNLNWMPQIEQMLDSPETEFVLVGAAHLVGPDGLLTLLKAKDYKVSRL